MSNLLLDDKTRYHRFLLDQEEYNPPTGLSPHITDYDHNSEKLFPALPFLPQEVIEYSLTYLACKELLQLRQVSRGWHSFINTDFLVRWLPTQEISKNHHLPFAQLIGIQLRARKTEPNTKPKFYSYEEEKRYYSDQSYRTAFVKTLSQTLKDKEQQIGFMALIEKRFGYGIYYTKMGYMTEKLFEAYTDTYPSPSFIMAEETREVDSLGSAIAKNYYFAAQNFLNKNPAYIHNYPVTTNFVDNTLTRVVGLRRLHIAHLLLHRGADANSKDGLYWTSPLQIAVSGRHPEMVKLLIDYGADVNYNYGTNRPSYGVSFSQLKAIGSPKFTPLYKAVKEDQPGIVKILLQHGACPEQCLVKGQTLLHLAVKLEALKILEFFLDEDMDTQLTDDKGLTPFQYALKKKRLKLMQVFLCHKAEPNYLQIFWEAKYPYCYGSRNILTDIIEALNSLEIDISQPNNQTLTPLCYAALKGEEKYVETLLQAGANVNYEGPEKLTPLCYAVMGDNRQIVELLLKAGANVNHSISNGCTLLALVNQKKDSYTKLSPLLKKYGAH